MKPKLVVKLPRKILQVVDKGRSVYTAITSNPMFKDIPSEFAAALERLALMLMTVKTAYDEAATRDTNKIARRNQLHEELKALLVETSRHVENFAQGNVKVLESSGFDVMYQKVRKISYPLVAAMIVVLHGEESGTFTVRGKRLPGAWRYETYITDDPTREDSWRLTHDAPNCSHIVIPGLTPGSLYSVRMRGIWPSGPGPWSVVATLRAL